MNKKIYLNLIPEDILIDAMKNMGYDEDADNADEQYVNYREKAEKLTAEQIFDKYLNWNGIIGYGSTLYQIVQILEKSKITQ